MPTCDVKVSAGGDDGIVGYYNSAWTFNNSGDGLWVGYIGASMLKYGSFMVFRNITVPRGSTINSAKIVFNCEYPYSNTIVRTTFHAQDVDSAEAPTTLAEYQEIVGSLAGGTGGGQLTSANADWDSLGAWSVNTNYGTDGTGGMPDIGTAFKAIIQEIVDRPGWASGNDLLIIWQDHEARGTQSGTVTRKPKSYDDTPSQAANLVIDYTPVLMVDTLDAANITDDGATLNGEIDVHGGQTCTQVGFVWMKNSDGGDPGNYAPDSSEAQALGWSGWKGTYSTDVFDHAVTGLDALSTYYCRACAYNATDGWEYGGAVGFQTIATHRISNSNTDGVKKDGAPIEGATICLYNMITGEVATEVTDSDGKYTHDAYGSQDVVPKFAVFCLYDEKAVLQTSQGSNKDLRFVAKATDETHWWPGARGNSLTITYANTGSLSVSVNGAAITVNIDAGTTTASQIKSAIEGHSDASKMVSVSLAEGQDGSGTPAVMSATNLSNGAYYTDVCHTFITPAEIT